MPIHRADGSIIVESVPPPQSPPVARSVTVLGTPNICFCKPSTTPNAQIPLVFIQGAVLVEDPAGERISRRLRQIDIDPDFNITGFSLSSGALVRRGNMLAGVTMSASYASGPPNSASIVDTFNNGAAAFAGAWVLSGPNYTSGSRSSTISATGVDGDPDPEWTAELTATVAGYAPRITTYTVYWSSDVYFGSNALVDISGTDVYTGGAHVGSFQSSLQRVRNQTRSFSGAGRYDWLLWPDEGTYTVGTPTFKDQSNFTFATVDMGTTSISRNGVPRTYRKIRSAGLLSSPFIVTVT